MKPEVAEKLCEARDFYALTKAVLSMCEPYGPVHAFRLVHNRGAARVACLVELESAKQHTELARALGARVLKGAACLEIPVDKDFGGPRRTVAFAPEGDVQIPLQAAFTRTHLPGR
jgi:hypothetical protein